MEQQLKRRNIRVVEDDEEDEPRVAPLGEHNVRAVLTTAQQLKDIVAGMTGQDNQAHYEWTRKCR